MQTTPRPHRSLSGWLFLLLIVLAIWAVQSGRVVIPDDWNPWAALDISAQPNLLTRFKLARASADSDACRTALAKAALVATQLPDRVTGPGCGFDNAFRIERTSVDVGAAFSLSCRAALSLMMWERHVLQQQTLVHLGSPVRRIEHLGSYACRNVYGQDGRRRSQHATADALDIAGFLLEDGRRIRVLRDWRSVGSGSDADADADDAPNATAADMQASALFLRALRDGACDWFDAVLGPDYNAAHADHFHFDRGRARICR